MICEACHREFEPPQRLSANQRAKRRFCSLKCAAKINPPPRQKPKPLEERFWAMVDKSAGPEGCWPWKGAPDEYGYGLFHVRNLGRTPVKGDPSHIERAHRVALRLSGVAIPDGKKALHRCDNPPCCNPAHLYAGTSKQNAEDRERRGRGKRPARRVTAEVPVASGN